jgi:hypothetical protein
MSMYEFTKFGADCCVIYACILSNYATAVEYI